MTGCLVVSCQERRSILFRAPAAQGLVPGPNEAMAAFAEGCFWHSEIIFQSLVGVRDAVSGYAGGTVRNPGYDQVLTGATGHAETVAVYYDTTKLTLQTLVKAFFASHDPTQIGHQGPDVGPQYRSIAFYRNEAEKAIIENEIMAINQSGRYPKKIATEVLPLPKFYPAEPEHQEYISRHKDAIYVHNVSIPDYLKFRQAFPGPYKDTLISQ